MAETVLQIRAVQKVMIHFETGNSNGFNGEITLPNIIAFDHKSHVPLLDGGSPVFRNSSNELADALKSKLRELGHVYGVKYN